jgi:hypothetical protein
MASAINSEGESQENLDGQSHYLARQLDSVVRGKKPEQILHLLDHMFDFSQQLPNTIKDAMHEKLRAMQATHGLG